MREIKMGDKFNALDSIQRFESTQRLEDSVQEIATLDANAPGGRDSGNDRFLNEMELEFQAKDQ